MPGVSFEWSLEALKLLAPVSVVGLIRSMLMAA